MVAHWHQSGFDKTVRLWDVASGKELKTLTGHISDVRSVCYSPDGRTLVSAGWEGRIKFWDVARAHEICTVLLSIYLTGLFFCQTMGALKPLLTAPSLHTFVLTTSLSIWINCTIVSTFQTFSIKALSGQLPPAVETVQSVALYPEVEVKPPDASTNQTTIQS